MVKVKEKDSKTKYRPAGVVINVNAMIYFKLKVQLNTHNMNQQDALFITNLLQ